MSPLRAPRAAAPSARLHLNRSGRAALPAPGRLRRSAGAFISPGISQYLWPRQENEPILAPCCRSVQLRHPAPSPGRCRRLIPFCFSDTAGTPTLSPLATEMTVTVALLLLSLLRTAAAKGEWCPACGVAALAPGAQRDALLALAKQSILAKLRLPGRPSVPQPPSRAALLTALRRMREQRSDPPGMPRDGRVPARPGPGLQEYEMLSFAEPGSSTSRSVHLHFRFSQEVAGSTEIQQATLYLFWAAPGRGAQPVTVRLLRPDPAGPNMTVASETRLEVQRPGWTTLDVGAAVRSLFGQETPRLTVELEVPEDWGSPLPSDHSDSHWPFVVAQAQARTPHRVRRRGVDCGADSRMCCRREFFVDFKEIGWEDWIIQPEGYHMNYCAGLCPLHMAGIPGLAASFHTAVLNRIKAASAAAAVDSCCVPTQRRPLSLLYYDRDSNIVKTDIPDMIVDSCGCT
ncbi:LOW QUALITY PROTEIN: inhibin beta C chain-like [Vidua chalybeata]|uniref:LOW QUALITY PROTEIN: inhibin beta C chain-like n=1 Tax=Vidua chalybeata TaxID=81927 RepID=UPI0023A7A5CE|nr:LOW QUALITY PROTEIN: inhibin beta C chain-like [Vidua chalybeata]